MNSQEIRQAQSEGRINYDRQRGIYNPARHGGRAVIVGCGGIGSPAALALAKLGIPYLTLIDFDQVETHNIPSQMFDHESTGSAKVAALKRLVNLFSPITEVQALNGKVMDDGKIYATLDDGVAEYQPEGVVIGALDSMEARQHLWSAVKDTAASLYIDGRLGGQQIVVYCVNPQDSAHVEFYEETLHDDGDSVEAPCTERAIIDVGFAIAALIVRAVRRHLTDQPTEQTVYLNQATLGLHTWGVNGNGDATS